MALFTLAQVKAQEKSVIQISTDNTDLILQVAPNGRLYQAYLGDKLLNEQDIKHFSPYVKGGSDGSVSTRGWEVYPGSGAEDYFEPAVAITHSDGNPSTILRYVSSEQKAVTGGTETIINLKDDQYPVEVTLHYIAYPKENVIKTWSEIKHNEKKPVTLWRYASTMLYFSGNEYYLTEFSSDWAKEAQMSTQPLLFGKKVIDTKLGSRAAMHTHPFFELGFEQPAQEAQGRVMLGTIGWTGNFQFTFEVDNAGNLRVLPGINPYASNYMLKADEVFTTPEFIFTLSYDGAGQGSRNLHDWARKYELKDGEGSRLTLLNNWENTGFNFNQDVLSKLMVEAKHLGVDMFLLDDGWFGNKYPRKNDRAGLGDWEVTHDKLPGGITALVKAAQDADVKFGIWIEPEMVNPKSELYEKHPEWIIKAPEREVVCARGGTQVVLDLSNPQVQDFIVQTVDELMNSYPDIDYIKWDANMSIITQGSQYLTKDNQSHLNIEYHRGFENVCRRIRASYPQLTIQACASGGGRVNYGVLPYFDEFWTSDNTDALQRIYIQWGTSYFFPAIGMGAHISASPNHQTSRSVPLKFRIDVAMSGRLGMEIQPKDMTEAEKALCRNAIAEYKTIRPVVQFGDIYRLLSPYDKQGAASLMYVSPEKDKAVFYWWKTEHFCNQHLPRVKMAGLAPNKYYKVHELNRIDTEPLKFEGKSFSGAYLNDNGLEIPSTHRVESSKQNEYASRVLYLEEVTPSSFGNRIAQCPPLRVLCLGNSITRHEYKADIEWFSEWGMAASKEENDYCHQLEKMLSQNRPGTVVTPLNIAYWERNLNCNIDSLIGTHVTDKDVIVIRLGENVQDKEAFKSGILRLVEYCKRKANKVVITGCFWKDDEKERAIINAAHMHGLTFIPIDWIDRLYDSRPKVGDTLYDIHGKPYTVTKDFIIAHPDDEGMKKIAEAIYRVL